MLIILDIGANDGCSILKFIDILSDNDYKKYILYYSELISNIVTDVFKTFFRKMKFNNNDYINLDCSYDLFYFNKLSDAFPMFHRDNNNKEIKNRINIYINTSGYNKVDLQFKKNDNYNPNPELIKIIDTDKNNVVWWNDSKIQHRTPVMLKEENIPRVFIFLAFNFNNKYDIDPQYDSNKNENNNQYAKRKYIFSNE